MALRHSIFFAVVSIAIFGRLSKAQAITAQHPNDSAPLDLFLDDEEFEKDYSFIVSFKFHLREEMLPQLFTEIALRNLPCAFKECDFSLIDIVEATQIHRFSQEVLAEAVNELHIKSTNFYGLSSKYNITAELVDKLLQNFGLTFSEIYKKYLDSLTNPSKTIPTVLNTLNVNVVDFMNAVAYGNDSEQLQVLFTGSYSPQNVGAVLNITNKTATDLIKLVPLNVIAKQLKTVNATEFTRLVENLGIVTADLINFYQYLNITPINFLSYPACIYIVSDFYELLNSDEVLGTIVSTHKILTSNKAKVFEIYQNQDTDIVRNYVNFHTELIENPFVQYLVKNITLKNPEYQSDHIGQVQMKDAIATEFAAIATDYNKTALINCTYITKLPFGGLYPEHLNQSRITLDNNALVVTKTNTTLYNLGSPIFCHDILYGLAVEEGATQIKFATFAKRTAGTSPTPGQQTVSESATIVPNTSTVSGHSSSYAARCGLFSIVSALVALKVVW